MKVKEVNIAPSSESGHLIKEAIRVVNLDEVNETFFVEGKSKMVTKNHSTLNIEGDALVTCQKVYNPFSKMFENSKD